MRGEWRQGHTAILPKFFFDHSSTSFSSWLGLLNRGSLRAQSPLSAAGFHCGVLFPTNSNRPGHLVILLSHVHRLPLFIRLFTQVHLLIDGSVEGQYITIFTGTSGSWLKKGAWWSQLVFYCYKHFYRKNTKIYNFCIVLNARFPFEQTSKLCGSTDGQPIQFCWQSDFI